MDATSPLLSSSAMDHQKIQNHFLIVPFPAHGHINPALEFSRRVIRCGVQITFVTTLFAHRNMINHSNSYPQELTFEPFSDGFDDADKNIDADQYLLQFRRYGSEALQRLVKTFTNASCPITCLIYTQGLNFAAEVAHKFELSSALLWTQPATVFDVFFYFFGDYKEVILHNINDPLYTVKLPGLPLLKAQDLPSYLLPSDPNPVGLKYFRGQFESLEQEAKSFTVLVNSFDQLEGEALKVVDRFNMIGIGPLIPSSIFSGKDSADGDLTDPSRHYIEWLDARDKSSVVYVSFGTFAVLSKKQMEELARGLVDSGKPFLWVIRSGKHGSMQQENDKDADETYRKILQEEHKGIVVPWSSQVEVLIHPSIGCFVTHCGWNSTLETLSAGVPVVGFPQFADQPTNAKLIEDVWKMGVRVRPNDEDKIVKSEEIVRCLEKVMEGESGDELRGNAKKWKELAKEAAREDGSSERNLRTFLHTFE